MLKISHFSLLVIHFFPTKAYKSEIQFNGEGWRPLTSEEVYKGLLTDFRKPNNIHIDASWSREAGYDDINLLTNGVIKLVDPQQIHSEFQIKMEGSYPVKEETIEFTNQRPESINKCETQEFKKCLENGIRAQASTESFKIYNNSQSEFNKIARKAKKITDEKLTSESRNDLIFTTENSHSEDENITRDTIRTSNKDRTDDYDESYEVTEHIENPDLADAEQTNIDDNTGYVYKPPNGNPFNPNNSNLTSTLINILSKYKINGRDELHNYELSRIPSKQGNFKPDFIYLPIPIRSIGSHNYNSLNHLPVNPLLAVFLSHYGYYLPGSYGVHNNYRNLYGYLASNNIHNNRPFGLYKVFSDTDSSNK